MIDDETIGRFDIENLFGKKRLEEILGTISAATGLGLNVLDYRGETITEPIGYPPFCRSMSQAEESKALCRSAIVYGTSQALARQKLYVYLCPCGLLEMAIPIIVKNHFLGSLCAGQVRSEQTPKEVPRLAKMFEAELSACPMGVQRKRDLKAVPAVKYDRFLGMAGLISLIVDQLCDGVTASHALGRDFSHELASVREETGRLEAELKMRSSEIVKLKSRWNSYFLINTLNAISNLAVIENSPRTNEMIILCADYLRHALMSGQNYVLLADEVESLECFLKTQKIRFGALLNYTISISVDASSRRIPVHVIMPFVERAVFYGTTTREAELNVALTISLEGYDLVVRIADDGPGLTEEEFASRFAALKRGHEGEAIALGLASARQRLGDLFGREYEMDVKNIAGRGSECVLRFPASLPADPA